MSRRKTIALSVLGVVVVSMSAFGVRVLSQAGQFTTIKNMQSGACQIYGGIPAPEDIVIDSVLQKAFISSLDRRSVSVQKTQTPVRRGSIQILDLATIKPGSKIRYKNVTPDLPTRFYPRGLSLYTGKDGTKRLFVINQGRDNTPSVEIFRVTPESLIYEKSVDLGTDVIFANDVLATGPDRFYVTDSAVSGVVSEAMNFSLQRKRSRVLYFNGNKISPVATDFVMANGIAMSKTGKEVYVTDTFSRSLRFFRRNPTTGALKDSGVLFIGTGVDNIDVAGDGSLWMAAHPRLIDFALYRLGLKAISPSQVIRAMPGKNGGGEVRTIYLNLGGQISGSSVAVAFDNRFIIGSARDNKLAICARK